MICSKENAHDFFCYFTIIFNLYLFPSNQEADKMKTKKKNVFSFFCCCLNQSRKIKIPVNKNKGRETYFELFEYRVIVKQT